MSGCSSKGCGGSGKLPVMDTNITMSTKKKTMEHPCFNAGAHKFSRMHIPVAPKCNIQCNYCNRKFDCQNESRPGVTSEVLAPAQALARYQEVKEKIENLRVIGIAGPGDALANFEETKKSIELIKEFDENVTVCLSTNGLLLPEYADQLVEIGVSHLTVTLNAVDPEIGEKIYSFVNYKGKILKGREAAETLLKNQLEGLRKLAEKDILLKVNVVLIKGINDHHVEEVVKTVKEIGVNITNIMPLIPVEGTPFETIEKVSAKELAEIRKQCSDYIPQMLHCKQCRADAIGKLGQDRSKEFISMDAKSKHKIKESECYKNFKKASDM